MLKHIARNWQVLAGFGGGIEILNTNSLDLQSYGCKFSCLRKKIVLSDTFNLGVIVSGNGCPTRERLGWCLNGNFIGQATIRQEEEGGSSPQQGETAHADACTERVSVWFHE